MQEKQQGQKLSKSDRWVHEVRQGEESYPLEQEQYERSFNSVNMKYLKFNNVHSILFTKLESNNMQKMVHIT